MKPRRHKTAAEQEAEFLAQVDDTFEKSASVAEEEDLAAPVPKATAADRMEERVEPPDSPDEEEPQRTSAREGVWRDQPSLRNQFRDHPEMVRFVEQQTKIFELPNDLDEFNKIQQGADADAEAPTHVIHTLEKQFWEGKWSVFLTFSKVQYQE